MDNQVSLGNRRTQRFYRPSRLRSWSNTLRFLGVGVHKVALPDWLKRRAVPDQVLPIFFDLPSPQIVMGSFYRVAFGIDAYGHEFDTAVVTGKLLLYVSELGGDDRAHVGAVCVQEREDYDAALQALQGDELAGLIGQLERWRGLDVLESSPVELRLGLRVVAPSQRDRRPDDYEKRQRDARWPKAGGNVTCAI